MKKFFIGLVLTLFILSLLPLVIYITYQNTEEVDVTESMQEEVEESKAIKESKFQESVIEEYPEINMGTLPSDMESSSVEFIGTWENDSVGIEQLIHKMTHQKVYAEYKFEVYELSEEHIDSLLSALKESNSNEEVEYYKEVLNKWKDGDFSNAVEVHNKVWLEEGGTIGKAERLLTPEEEQDFVERNFR
ncbi:hypothetical protein CAT7_05270 [Carnobacterium sp. AT7]|uniref:DUF6241 domain-containing protein n=1 Tax=Carnobacterium TaxID=2747 RepID=UPI00015EFEAF|nr:MULTISPECIES: DUF6241 domain-containing protein [Carnobacterium]EDP67232.1 hypothetical protein CAT7_05270 [Carnobacterium sp. AT7]